MKRRQHPWIFFVLIGLLMLCGCTEKTLEQGPITETGHIYTVGIRGVGFETKGKLFYDEEDFLHLINEDPASPLFGLEEITNGKVTKALFGDVSWESEEVSLFITRLKKALDEMTSAPLTKKEDTTLDGVECISYSYLSEGTRGFVWRKKADGALMKIILIGDTCEAEINFFKDNE